jgi:hypothetical protein
MTTFEEGLISTWRFPRFSALNMFFNASFNTLILTIVPYLSKPGTSTHALLHFPQLHCQQHELQPLAKLRKLQIPKHHTHQNPSL